MTTKLKSFLVLLAVVLLVPQGVKADIVTTTYDFKGSIDAGNTTVTMSGNTDATYTNCEYFSTIGNVQGAARFAAQGDWVLTEAHKMGLYSNNSGGRRFLVSKLFPGDIVTFDVADVYGNAQTISLESTNATASGNTFTMTAKGTLCVNLTRYWNVKSITVQHDNSAAYYAYDPAIEIYDLTQQNNGSASMSSNSTGYNLDNSAAYYIENSGYELNNRVAITTDTGLTWNSGLLFTATGGTTHNIVSISNLHINDRVRITYSKSEGNLIFASEGSVSNNKVFLDAFNDGEKDDTEDIIVHGWDGVTSGAWYTMLEDGHMDIVLVDGVKITKIEIASDRKAAYIDTDNGGGSHTLTFEGTGQLVEKTAYIPGLKIEFGDADAESEHFFVTLTNAGPVSWGKDPDGFKMAKRTDQLTTLTKVPYTGTFYKFIPEVSGTLDIRFKALSVQYPNLTSYNSNPEIITDASCPYVFVDADANGNITEVKLNTNKANGATVNNYGSNQIRLTKGHTYYFYGWWNDSSCGVAKLLSAKYTPSFLMPELACVTTNGATSFDGSASTPNITISGNPTNLIFEVKKTSENISVNASDISLENGYLKISKISYNDSKKDKAGVILVKATADEGEHVFALTIPYSAAKGHKWDFFSQPLEIGRYFSDFYANAKVQNRQKLSAADTAAMAKNTQSQLYCEIEKSDGSGTDWTFTYRQVGMNGSAKDPMFQNVYKMKGDNANKIWETEGLWFDTPSNKSAIMNERLGAASQYPETTDPDRYVAILPGGSFTIPALQAGDRVVIFMGSGYGSSDDVCFLNITNALDAIGKQISPTDTYKAGGSLWTAGGNTVTYRGAYQFISTGGDMKFYMNSGSMTKIYSIEIYQGVKQATVDATRVASVTYNNEVYNTNRWWLNNDSRSDAKLAAYQLHYRGKGQRLKDPTPLYTSGTISTDNSHLFYATIGDNNAPHFFFKSVKGEYGTVRMRIDDMEMNDKYVADYALQNLTVSYLEKKPYPYTWDFTDLKGYVDTSNRIQAERTLVGSYAPKTETGNYDIEFMNNTVETDVKPIEQWKSYSEEGDIPAGFGLHVRNEPYNGGVMWCNGQLYAGDEFFGETEGLSINVPVTDAGEQVHQQFNGDLRICEDGLCVTGGSSGSGYWSITVPQVSTNDAIYVRASRIGSRGITAGVGDASTVFTYAGTATDGTNDLIYAVKGTGGDMKLYFNNVIIKKIAVASDFKTVNAKGWATESRARVIDPTLTSFMTGKDMRTYIVTGYDFPKKQVTLMRVDDDTKDPFEGYLIPIASDGDDKACIIRNYGGERVQILDDGFHLFYPDMHDYNVETPANSLMKVWSDEKKTVADSGTGTETEVQAFNNLLKSQLSSTENIPYMSGEYTNYAFTCTYYDIDPETAQVTNNTPHIGDQAFYRIAKQGGKSRGNQAYLPMLVPKPANSRAAARAAAASESAPLSFSLVIKNRSSILYKLGDINGDGSFNKLDVNTMADHLAGRPTARFVNGVADMNDDGNIDVVDLTLMIQKIVDDQQ